MVTLYGRDGCHLCEEARVRLEEMRRGGAAFALMEIDIESDADMHRRIARVDPRRRGRRRSRQRLILDADAVRAGSIPFPGERAAQRTRRPSAGAARNGLDRLSLGVAAGWLATSRS
ncbi:MAG: glutaredoxin family protein [Solirubrobacterales bacterium]